jgi:OHCU decarboxylase
VTLAELNALPADRAAAALQRCCGSTRWARQMAARRPFHSETELVETADHICASLEREDWLEAFAAHPRIGGGAPGVAGEGSDWSADEQSGMRSADDRVQQRLAEANREYEHRFGYIFIVCATGKPAGEMLALLDERLHNAADRELTIAAAEQRQITQLRLRKLLNE